MENPATWNLLTSSLAACDLQMPEKAWAFLVLQGLVRDAPGDREFFQGIIQQEKSSGAITGPSLQSRIAGRLEEFGIALALAAAPDPNAEMARKRLQTLQNLLKDKEPFEAVRRSLFCTHCGVEVEKRPDVCPACGKAFQDFSETCLKSCERCKIMNPLSANYCCSCGMSFGSLNAFVATRETRSGQYESYPDSGWGGYCRCCGHQTSSDDKYCRRCGMFTDGPGAQVRKPTVARGPHDTGEITDEHRKRVVVTSSSRPSWAGQETGDLPRSGYWQTRLFRLIDYAREDKAVADFLAMLVSAIQDLTVIKQLLAEKGVWDEELYRKLRRERLVADHSGAGATPWKSYSIYPYTLDEAEFLEEIFNAGEEEIARFKEKVETISELS